MLGAERPAADSSAHAAPRTCPSRDQTRGLRWPSPAGREPEGLHKQQWLASGVPPRLRASWPQHAAPCKAPAALSGVYGVPRQVLQGARWQGLAQQGVLQATARLAARAGSLWTPYRAAHRSTKPRCCTCTQVNFERQTWQCTLCETTNAAPPGSLGTPAAVRAHCILITYAALCFLVCLLVWMLLQTMVRVLSLCVCTCVCVCVPTQASPELLSDTCEYLIQESPPPPKASPHVVIIVDTNTHVSHLTHIREAVPAAIEVRDTHTHTDKGTHTHTHTHTHMRFHTSASAVPSCAAFSPPRHTSVLHVSGASCHVWCRHVCVCVCACHHDHCRLSWVQTHLSVW